MASSFAVPYQIPGAQRFRGPPQWSQRLPTWAERYAALTGKIRKAPEQEEKKKHSVNEEPAFKKHKPDEEPAPDAKTEAVALDALVSLAAPATPPAALPAAPPAPLPSAAPLLPPNALSDNDLFVHANEPILKGAHGDEYVCRNGKRVLVHILRHSGITEPKPEETCDRRVAADMIRLLVALIANKQCCDDKLLEETMAFLHQNRVFKTEPRLKLRRFLCSFVCTNLDKKPFA